MPAGGGVVAVSGERGNFGEGGDAGFYGNCGGEGVEGRDVGGKR